MKKTFVIGVIVLFLSMAIMPSISSQTVKNQNINMRIDFFEEIPTIDNLEKAILIDFPSTIYLAAHSLEEFRELEKNLSLINPELEAGYWPILEKTYYVSPFCYTYELENLIIDLEKNKYNKTIKVLIDLELPWNISQNIKNLFCFHKNKNLIQSLFKNANEFNITIITAEFPAPFKFTQLFFKLIGISYSIRRYSHTMSVMYYSSVIEKMSPKLMNPIKKMISYNSKKYGSSYQVGLGVIEPGVNESLILDPENLDKDLNFLNDNGINTAIIFRLAGLNESYINVIKKYL